MIDYIVWFYGVSCLLFNVLFLWYDSREGVMLWELLIILIVSLIPAINTFGVIWILNKEGKFSVVILKRGSK